MEHHLVANIEILYGIEQIVLGRGQGDPMPSDKCPYKMGGHKEILVCIQLDERHSE